MGGKLEDAQAAIALYGSLYETKTHPSKSSRLAAIANGWYSSNTNYTNQK